jgi:hypothetical protein
MSEQLYSTTNQGLASFLIFVLSEDCFSHIELNDSKRPIIWLHDVTKGNPCKELAEAYMTGAQLRDAREYSNCWEMIGHEIRKAFRTSKKK